MRTRWLYANKGSRHPEVKRTQTNTLRVYATKRTDAYVDEEQPGARSLSLSLTSAAVSVRRSVRRSRMLTDIIFFLCASLLCCF